MANVALFENDPHYQRAITSYVHHNGHTVELAIGTLPDAYAYMNELITDESARGVLDAFILTDTLGHDELNRRPDFTGPYVQTMPEDLAELMPVDSPGFIKGAISRWRKKPEEEPEQPETTTLERMPMGSDAALIAEINKLYDLRIPIIGMAEMPLATRGVMIDAEFDLTKENLLQLAPLLAGFDQERERRRQQLAAEVAAIRDAGAQTQARRGSAWHRTRRPRQ